MRTIGLLGGMSWESTAIYYRLMNERVRDRLGGLHSASLLLLSYEFAEIAAMQSRGAWTEAGQLLSRDARRLQSAGASAVMICTNTMHEVADAVEASISVPLIHIVDPTAQAMKAAQVRRPALLATRFTMERAFYAERLRTRHGFDVIVPDDNGRRVIHDGIYDELCRGIVSETTKAAYLKEIERLRERGADSVIFGCTEITLLISAADVALPVFDSTALHAAAGVDWVLA
jgi:aspartate racemase